MNTNKKVHELFILRFFSSQVPLAISAMLHQHHINSWSSSFKNTLNVMLPVSLCVKDLAQRSMSTLPRKENETAPKKKSSNTATIQDPPKSSPNWQTCSIQDTKISSCVKEIAIFPGQPSCSMQKVKHCLKSCKLIIRINKFVWHPVFHGKNLSGEKHHLQKQDPELNRVPSSSILVYYKSLSL